MGEGDAPFAVAFKRNERQNSIRPRPLQLRVKRGAGLPASTGGH
jgi:hypothetical protein